MHRTHFRPRRHGAVAVEAAITLPVLLILMIGIWEAGRIIQVNQVLINAAREGARLAAGGYVDGAPVTAAMVQQGVRNYMATAGLPAAAVEGTQVSVICHSSPSWSHPADALPLDRFQVEVVIPQGPAFDSLRWSLLNRLSSVDQMSVTVDWVSLNNAKILVDTNLPF